MMTRVKKTTDQTAADAPVTVTSDNFGELLVESVREAVEIHEGRAAPARTRRYPAVTARRATAVPAPTYTGADVRRIREALEVSQEVFAGILNVSTATIRSWEQEQREPDSASQRLLQIADQSPAVFSAFLDAAPDSRARIPAQLKGKSRSGRRGVEQPIWMEWGHVALSSTFHPGGTLDLKHMMDAVVIPSGQRSLVWPQVQLLIRIQAIRGTKLRHQMRVSFINPDGKPRADQWRQEITLNDPGPTFPLVTVVRITLNDWEFTQEGVHQFNVHLGNQFLDTIDLFVFRQENMRGGSL